MMRVWVFVLFAACLAPHVEDDGDDDGWGDDQSVPDDDVDEPNQPLTLYASIQQTWSRTEGRVLDGSATAFWTEGFARPSWGQSFDVELGSCELNWESEWSAFDAGPSALTLLGSSFDLYLSQDPNTSVYQASFTRSATGDAFGLRSDAVPELGLNVDSFVSVPPLITLTEPLFEGTTIPLPEDEFVLKWSAADAAYVSIFVLVAEERTGVVLEYLNCAVPNTGVFTVPTNQLPQWRSGRYGGVYIAPIVERSGTFDSGIEWHTAGANYLENTFVISED